MESLLTLAFMSVSFIIETNRVISSVESLIASRLERIILIPTCKSLDISRRLISIDFADDGVISASRFEVTRVILLRS